MVDMKEVYFQVYNYRVIQQIDDGLAAVASTFGRQMWTRVIARKEALCHLTGRPIHRGAAAYRPITNGRNRSHRILASAVEGKSGDPD